ncbi:MAG: GntR family transcriptional regulator [Pseudolysinimonas sp.]
MTDSQHVVDRIRHQLLRAEIAPGAVVNESTFVAQLGASRAQVREALQRLTIEGFVSVLPRKGYVIRPVSLNDIRDVMDLRLIVEPNFAAAAARGVDSETTDALSHLIETQFDSSTTMSAQLDASREFHMTMARASGNRRAELFLTPLVDEITRLHWLMPAMRSHITSSAERDAHLTICDALIRQDPTGASEAMANHLSEVDSAMLNSFLASRS